MSDDTAWAHVAQLEHQITLLRVANAGAWKLLGRCEPAFELIATARSVVTARETARKLQDEIKQAVIRARSPMLNERSAYLTRVLDDGRVVDIVPLTFGRARIVISDSLADLTWTDGW